MQSSDAYQEIIPLMSDVSYAIDDLLQKAYLCLVLSMSYITACVLFRGIGTNESFNRKERFRRVCGSIYPDADVVVNRLFGEKLKAASSCNGSFAKGMTFHTYMLTKGFGMSETIAITMDGYERLTTFSRQLFVT